MSDDETFLRRAIALAREARDTGVGPPFGTVIVRQGLIIAEACNRVTAENDPTWHAEVAAIRAACQRMESPELPGCVIYASSEPCPMCACAIYYAKLDRLVYGSSADEARRWAGYTRKFTLSEAGLPWLQRSLPAEQMLQREAGEVFTTG